jgi:putative NADH-flavin reductase
MKIALIGVTGNVGKRILAESQRRGHVVTGIARDFSGAAAGPQGSAFRTGDADHPGELAAVLKGHHAAISGVPFRGSDPAKLIDAVRRSGVKRYLVVGGKGSPLAAKPRPRDDGLTAPDDCRRYVVRPPAAGPERHRRNAAMTT